MPAWKYSRHLRRLYEILDYKDPFYYNIGIVTNKEQQMNGYWIFDEYEDDWVYVPSAEELAQ